MAVICNIGLEYPAQSERQIIFHLSEIFLFLSCSLLEYEWTMITMKVLCKCGIIRHCRSGQSDMAREKKSEIEVCLRGLI